MLNNRDDKDESEYHFSDDEVTYEVEPESQKPAASGKPEPASNVMAKVNQSKRLIISVVVFLVLVFVVYKMVAPTSTAPSIDITAAPPAAPPAPQAQTMPPQTAQAPAAAPQVVAPPNQMAAAPTQPVAAPLPAGVAPQATPTEQPTLATQPSAAPQSGVVQPLPSQATTQPPPIPQQAAVAPVPQAAPPQQTLTAMPTVIPVQSATPTYMPSSAQTAAATANLAAQNEKLVSQLEADYTQKINDFAQQNKALQDQLQLLSTRVASMETQMGQLVQALTRQQDAVQQSPGPSSSVSVPATPQTREVADTKLPYTVQAIIPGRAWLKGDNGETLTVAEGDIIKDVGRVTKIDPYDGIVQINTGSKVVSLSYGNGG